MNSAMHVILVRNSSLSLSSGNEILRTSVAQSRIAVFQTKQDTQTMNNALILQDYIYIYRYAMVC